MSFVRVVKAPWVAVDWVNGTEAPRDVDYASATAPAPCFITVEVIRVNGKAETADGVHIAAGGSHSWWAGAQGKLLRRGLAVGERLRVVGTAPFAFRWDWTDE